MINYKNYSLYGLARLIVDLIYTKLVYRGARLVRFPIYIRGKKNIDFGTGLTTGRHCRIDAFNIDQKPTPIIKFGDNCQINDNVHIAGINSISIGNNVLIASRVFISDHNHGNYRGVNQSSPLEIPSKRKLNSSPIIIEDNVWIGEGVAILPGVIIGKGTIIATNSVLTKDAESYTIYAGIPAKPIKKYDFKLKQWISKK
ncbi:hypothetical protein FTDG_00987 [Francisella tularensis subsp. novicida GA99-3548]|uniref:DapH/DapD/GlmU-related protein n=1 Tax=Francisella tularensis TaxID=263 RepID=UPI000158B3AD|nr:DapH/DapD/GlmU-related protein [Francisella tularensis]AJI73001.1 hexapeptide repeat of succinyl-transferase family protein [Francisella tularensis subsp. novicida D9876]EDN38184.1 hypothetical protein FTDG_00987 [Francisella tularensis subsp. novicida GA99-3548]MBK2111620.1 acetyltransferase [Francisella tularensis subsp. novicida FSC159]